MGKRDLLQEKNILIVWGMKDIAFRKKELNRWTDAYPRAKVICLDDTGHFVPEEMPDVLIREMRKLIGGLR
jgi:haloalkane dehalogenase